MIEVKLCVIFHQILIKMPSQLRPQKIIFHLITKAQWHGNENKLPLEPSEKNDTNLIQISVCFKALLKGDVSSLQGKREKWRRDETLLICLLKIKIAANATEIKRWAGKVFTPLFQCIPFLFIISNRDLSETERVRELTQTVWILEGIKCLLASACPLL